LVGQSILVDLFMNKIILFCFVVCWSSMGYAQGAKGAKGKQAPIAASVVPPPAFFEGLLSGDTVAVLESLQKKGYVLAGEEFQKDCMKFCNEMNYRTNNSFYGVYYSNGSSAVLLTIRRTGAVAKVSLEFPKKNPAYMKSAEAALTKAMGFREASEPILRKDGTWMYLEKGADLSKLCQLFNSKGADPDQVIFTNSQVYK
jgi:hypothetical protein